MTTDLGVANHVMTDVMHEGISVRTVPVWTYVLLFGTYALSRFEGGRLGARGPAGVLAVDP